MNLSTKYMTPGRNSKVSRERESADNFVEELVCEMVLVVNGVETRCELRYCDGMCKDIFSCAEYFYSTNTGGVKMELNFNIFPKKIRKKYYKKYPRRLVFDFEYSFLTELTGLL